MPNNKYLPPPALTGFAQAANIPVPVASHYRDDTKDLLPMASHSQLNPGVWDKRPDGSQKGNGFLGVLPRPDGSVMSEYSVADSEQLRDAKGGYLDYPTLVPTLKSNELSYLLNMRPGEKLPASIYQKAEAHALARKAQGKPLFAQPGEEDYTIDPEFRRKR